MRHVDPAIADLKQVLALDPSNRQAKRLLAQALAMQHDSAEAVRYACEATSEALPDPIPKDDDFVLPRWQCPPQTKN